MIADIGTYPVFPVNDAVGNLHPLWLRRSFLSLLQLWLLFHHFLPLNNVICQLAATIIQWRLPVEVARLSFDVGHCYIPGWKWPV